MPYSTKSSVVLYLAALALTVGNHHRVLAANNWFSPCTNGQCSWDLPAHSGASGTLQIWGPTNAISDITRAAGWKITHCDPSATTQDIRLVCTDGNPDCDHLFQGGAVDTIIRLPDACGPMPFARVAKHWTNQTDTHNSPGVTKRASDAHFHTLALDMNFTAATPSLNGSVYFTIQGLNVKGSNGGFGLTTPAAVNQHRGLGRRGLHGPRGHVHQRNFLGISLQALQNSTAFNKTISQNLQPFDYSGSANLFNTSIDVSADSAIPSSSTAFASLDVDAAVHAAVSLGAVAAGTLVPPSISEFGLTLGMNGNIDALFSIMANLTGHVSSGSVSLFKIGIPGLSFPGILEVGPEFKVTGMIDADLALTNVSASVKLAYNLNEVAVTFPPQSHSTGGTFKQGVGDVSVSASPSVTDATASMNVTGHLIPRIDIGLSALGGIVSTTVFLNLDASTGLNVSVNAEGTGNSVDKTVTPVGEACVDADTGLAVNIGAEGSFLDIFNASTGATLFDKSFPLLQKCVGLSDSTSTNHVASRNYVLALDGDDTDKSKLSVPSTMS